MPTPFSARHRRAPLTDAQAALLAMCNCRRLPRRPHTRLYCQPVRDQEARVSS